jgi:hypothetical protein
MKCWPWEILDKARDLRDEAQRTPLPEMRLGLKCQILGMVEYNKIIDGPDTFTTKELQRIADEVR